MSDNAPFVADVKQLRTDTKPIAAAIKALMSHEAFAVLPDGADVGEMKANIMLAYRAMEDCRMRLGKIIQAHEGGESPYDK